MSSARIHILPRTVAERIAAGEVVERPASVVKELIENALDAGATAVSIEIREGGSALIRVGDNGSGMSREDAALAVERFATSKIASDRDLQTVRTLGFRGEALPSIATVSQLELLTRARDEIEGTRVRSTGEGRAEVEVAGAPNGTQVTVRNLFYNAPARRKFLKPPLRETELVQKTVMLYSLAYPVVAFRFVVDGRESLVAPAATPLERIGAVWGREAAAEMLQLEYQSVDLAVHGYISRPSLARASRDWEAFFVNGRPVRSGLLAVMLERPYAGRLPPNRHPLAVVQVELDPSLLDVNVHPRKSEVRIYQERAVYGAVAQAVEQALREIPAPSQSQVGEWPFANVGEPEAGAATILRESSPGYPGVALAAPGSWRAVAQVHNTYILAQTPEGFVIVDQHAAQEQIFYELLTTGRAAGASSGSSSFTPRQVPLTAREGELLGEHLEEYRSLGIDVEPFGENTFRVRAVPALGGIPVEQFLAALLSEHERYRNLEGDPLRDKLAAKAACVSAIKAGDALDPAEQQSLLDQLLAAYAPATCPHGRPVFITLRLEELERRFLRR